MTVKELIAQLSELPECAIVRLYCDHGQASMLATTVTAQHMTKKDARSWMCDDGECEKPTDAKPCNVVEIGAP